MALTLRNHRALGVAVMTTLALGTTSIGTTSIDAQRERREAREPLVQRRVVDREELELLVEIVLVPERERPLVLLEPEPLRDPVHEREHWIAPRRQDRP